MLSSPSFPSEARKTKWRRFWQTKGSKIFKYSKKRRIRSYIFKVLRVKMIYSGIPIFRTTLKKANWFELSEGLNKGGIIAVFDWWWKKNQNSICHLCRTNDRESFDKVVFLIFCFILKTHNFLYLASRTFYINSVINLYDYLSLILPLLVAGSSFFSRSNKEDFFSFLIWQENNFNLLL